MDVLHIAASPNRPLVSGSRQAFGESDEWLYVMDSSNDSEFVEETEVSIVELEMGETSGEPGIASEKQTLDATLNTQLGEAFEPIAKLQTSHVPSAQAVASDTHANVSEINDAIKKSNADDRLKFDTALAPDQLNQPRSSNLSSSKPLFELMQQNGLNEVSTIAPQELASLAEKGSAKITFSGQGSTPQEAITKIGTPELPASAISIGTDHRTVETDAQTKSNEKNVDARRIDTSLPKAEVSHLTIMQSAFDATTKPTFISGDIEKMISHVGSIESAPNLNSVEHSKPIAQPVLNNTQPTRDQAVLLQVVQSIEGVEKGSVELRLDPAELGKVRITMVARDGVMHATITAERPETLEILRRNSDELSLGFGDQGFSESELDFQQSERDDQFESEDNGQFLEPTIDNPVEVSGSRILSAASHGLDIKI